MMKMGRGHAWIAWLLVMLFHTPLHAEWIEFEGRADGTWKLLETDPPAVTAATDFTLRLDVTKLIDPALESDGTGSFRIDAGGFEFCYVSTQLGEGCFTAWNGIETDPNDILDYQYAHLSYTEVGESRYQLRFDAVVPQCDFVQIPENEVVPGDPCARVALSVVFFARPGAAMLPAVSGWEHVLASFDAEAVELDASRDAVWISPYCESDAVRPLWAFEGPLVSLATDTVGSNSSSFGRIKALYGGGTR